jgi:tRNA (cmo5U34)-methyltransferase
MSMNTSAVRDHFRVQVDHYPGLMGRIIPGYAEQRDLMVRLVPFESGRRIRILDLGCGPGLLAQQLLREFPQAELTALDLTNEMLDACRQRAGDESRMDYRLADFRTDDLGSGYDVITASLSLHHLTFAERPDFFARAYDSLNPGGVLIAAEVIIDESPDVRASQYRLWQEFMIANGEDGEQWFSKHTDKDHPATITSLISWLGVAGFVGAGWYWRQLNFAVLRAARR